MRSPTLRISAIFASRSAFSFIWPICLLTVLRSARRVSTSARSALRWSSSSRMQSMGTVVLRRRTSRFTRSTFSRMNWALSMGGSECSLGGDGPDAEQPDILGDRHERTIGRFERECLRQLVRPKPTPQMLGGQRRIEVDGLQRAREVDVIDVLVEGLVGSHDVL